MKNEKVLRPVNPNVAIRAEYRRKLDRLIDEMTKSYAHWILAQYRKKPPRLAMDATPAEELAKALGVLGKDWEKRLNAMAPRLAKWFLQKVSKRSMAALKKILKDGGMTVQFKMSPVMLDIVDASITENVALIKSIGEQYHRQIEGMVMRSVAKGGDLGTLSKDLRKQYGVTKKRAALIARDQNNKATAVITRVSQMQAGIKEAVWLHSLGGKEPRPTHLANNQKKYNIEQGWYDPDPKVRRRIWPGELINCRCVSKPVVKGFS